MPLQQRGKKQMIIEPVTKRIINYVERSDIPCNVEGCQTCEQIAAYRPIFDREHPVLLPSLGIIMRRRHILEFINELQQVFLISIMNILKSADLLFYNSLTKISGANMYFFHDQVCNITKLEEYSEEEALREVYFYYEEHGAKPVVLAENGEIEKGDLITVDIDHFFTEETHQLLCLKTDLETFLNCDEELYVDGYLPYIEAEELPMLSDSGAVLVGEFKANRGGLSGFILNEIVGRIEFPGKYFANRALNFDIVYFRLLLTAVDKDEIVQEEHLFPLEQGIYKDIHLKSMEAVVVGIKSRKLSKFCGTLEKMFGYTLENDKLEIETLESSDFYSSTVVTVNESLPKFFIRSSTTLAPYCGERCQFEFEDWGEDNRIPTCILCESLGPVANEDVESEVILREREVRHFDLEANEEILDELPREILNSLDSFRVDLTEELVCSIDPIGCKDIDDALHYTIIGNATFEKRWGKHLLDLKNYGKITEEQIDKIRGILAQRCLIEVGIHIADVSHYVKKGSAIDAEASLRCTSVYLQDRRIDMLPKLLTEQVCSLVADGKRFCFSCILLFDVETDEELVYRFAKTIVENMANLSYQDAEMLIDCGVNAQIDSRFNSSSLKTKLVPVLRGLLSISRFLKEERINSGALELDSAEANYKLDETGMPIAVDAHANLPAMSMIEEFMLLANYHAAEIMLDHYPSASLLRKHPISNPELFTDLKCKLERFDLHIDTSSSETISASIQALSIKLEDQPKLLETVRILLTRCMSLAKYFASGKATEPEFFHFGLALKYYTHFTSPIRRYSDIIVHRIVAACINVDQALYSLDELADECVLLNERKEQADRASRDSTKIFGVLFLLETNFKHQEHHYEDATVIGIQASRVFVVVPRMGVELQIAVEGALSVDGLETNLEDGRKMTMFEELRVRVFYDFDKPYRFTFKAEIV